MDPTDERWNEFERLEEIQVRKNLANRIYSEEKTLLAEQWLAHSDGLRRAAEFAKIDASNLEQIRVARSAKNAAWTAAITAIIAAIIAAICAVIAATH
jgi:hypothetical protein